MRKKASSGLGLGGRPISGSENIPLSPTPESLALLAAFRAIAANDIYAMAPKESVVRGYEYYRQQRLHHYVWNQSRTALTAQVQGTRLYSVVFALSDEFLEASCDCPAWEPVWLCKHVMCACFTTKHLLSPETFTVPAWQETKLPTLRAELLGHSPEAAWKVEAASSGTTRKGSARKGPTYEIVIDVRHTYPRLLIHRNGVPLSGGWVSALPPELVPLLNGSWFSGFGEDPLLHYLRSQESLCPIVLMFGKESIPLHWSQSVKCRSKTEIDLVGNEIRVRAVCLANGVPLERIARFRTFVADLTGGRLLYLKDEIGWASFRSLRQRFKQVDPFLDSYDDLDEGFRAVPFSGQAGYGRPGANQDTEFRLTLDEFQSAQVELMPKLADRVLGDLKLKIDGQDVSVQRLALHPSGIAPSCALILKPPSKDSNYASVSWTLQAQCRRGDAQFAPSVSTFGCIFALEQGRAVSSALRAKKRKAVLYDTFFRLLSVREAKERDQRIKTAIGMEDWSRGVSDEAVQWLRQSLSGYARQDARLRICVGRWELQPVDKAREALLYRIPFEVFGPEVFRGMRRCDEMTIDALRLFQRLPALLETLTTAGIELLYEDKPLQASTWDCSVHVDRGDREGAGIDWFEIRPEIRCDGVALSETEWRSALQQGGLIDVKGGLRVLDSQTLERLRAIFELTGEAQTDRAATQIVRVPRLQILDWLALREQGIVVSLPAEDEALLARLLGFTRIAVQPLPKGLRATLRPYQQDGYAWLAFL